MIEMRAEVAAGRASQHLQSGEVDRTTISCRKSEQRYTCPMSNLSLLHAEIWWRPFRRRFLDDKARGKIFF
jgi:hypothetical protein